MSKTRSLYWKVNTGGLLKEVLSNNETQMLLRPLQLLASLLEGVATRAAQLRDPELDKLMVRMALYEFSDPYSPKYDASMVSKILDGKG